MSHHGGRRPDASSDPTRVERTAVRVRQVGGRLDAEEVVRLRDAELVDVDLGNLRLRHFEVLSGTLVGCEFTRFAARGGRMSGVERPVTYRRCRFHDADLRGVRPGPARFEECTFDDVRLDGWICHQTEFVGCRFVGELRDIAFWGETIPQAMVERLDRASNEFSGNDFRSAALTDVRFVGGIDLANQKLPCGPEYVHVDHLADRVSAARSAVAVWDEATEREAAMGMLTSLSQAGYESQGAFFGRRSEVERVAADVRDRVWNLLTEN